MKCVLGSLSWLIPASVLAGSLVQGQKPVLPPSLSPREKRQLSIENIGEGGWRVSPNPPRAILSRADQWLSRAHGISGQDKYLYENGDKYGFQVCELAIESPRRFKIGTAKLIEVPERDVARYTMTADGDSLQTFDISAGVQRMPLRETRLPADVFSVWARDFQILIFAGLGTSDQPLSQFLISAKRAGVTFVSERRSITINGQNFSTDRVLGTRKATASSPLIRFEILVDAKTGAPITLRVAVGSGRNQVRSMWTCRWNLRPQKFPPSMFTVLPH